MTTSTSKNKKHDKIFIERTRAAMSRIEDNNEDWLSVDEFLKELKTW